MTEQTTGAGGDVDANEDYYTLVPEQGLCLVGNDIINLKAVSVIRRIDGKTLVYYTGANEPVILPFQSFETIRDAVFAMDDPDDDEDDLEDED